MEKKCTPQSLVLDSQLSLLGFERLTQVTHLEFKRKYLPLKFVFLSHYHIFVNFPFLGESKFS